MYKAIRIVDNKVEIKEFPTGNGITNWLYEHDNIYYKHIINGSYGMFLGSNQVNDQLGCTKSYFMNEIAANALGFHYDYELRKMVTTKPSTDWLRDVSYEKYDLISNDALNIGTTSRTFNLTNGLKYTFGVEIETSGGTLPAYIAMANRLNLKSEYDGSIKGGEYITGILKGDEGFIHLNSILSLLRKTTKIDKTCGVHVHIGGADFNKSFTVFSYLLGLRLEHEVFTTLPKSRSNNRYCDLFSNHDHFLSEEWIVGQFKEHGYEAAVDIIYDELYEQMSYGETPGRYNNKLSGHKYGRYCGQYQDIPMCNNFRYKWVNLMPINFNMKGGFDLETVKSRNTIEFRNHSASLSYIKIRNWVLFCMAYVSFVENNKGILLDLDTPLTMDLVLREVYGRKAEPLIEYFNERKEIFKKDVESTEYTITTMKKERNLTKLKDICVL